MGRRTKVTFYLLIGLSFALLGAKQAEAFFGGLTHVKCHIWDIDDNPPLLSVDIWIGDLSSAEPDTGYVSRVRFYEIYNRRPYTVTKAKMTKEDYKWVGPEDDQKQELDLRFRFENGGYLNVKVDDLGKFGATGKGELKKSRRSGVEKTHDCRVNKN